MKDPEPKLIFPDWGKYGVRIELKLPNAQFKNPKLMISEVVKDDQALTGWKFFMRTFNDTQKARGYYNAHCSIPTDSLPMVIATLVELWDEFKPDGADNVSEHTRDIALEAKHGEQAGELLRDSKTLGELQEASPKRKPAAPTASSAPAGEDPWDMVRKKMGGPSKPAEPEPDSDEGPGEPPF